MAFGRDAPPGDAQHPAHPHRYATEGDAVRALARTVTVKRIRNVDLRPDGQVKLGVITPTSSARSSAPELRQQPGGRRGHPRRPLPRLRRLVHRRRPLPPPGRRPPAPTTKTVFARAPNRLGMKTGATEGLLRPPVQLLALTAASVALVRLYVGADALAAAGAAALIAGRLCRAAGGGRFPGAALYHRTELRATAFPRLRRTSCRTSRERLFVGYGFAGASVTRNACSMRAGPRRWRF